MSEILQSNEMPQDTGSDNEQSIDAAEMSEMDLGAMFDAPAEAEESDDDEVEAFQRWFVPPWDRGEELVILENNGTKKRYVPMGYMLPHYELTRAINIGVKAAQPGMVL